PCWPASSASVARAMASSRLRLPDCKSDCTSFIVYSCGLARDQRGGAVAGADRAFDGGGQAGIGPVAGQRQIAPSRCGTGPLGVLRRRGRKRRPPLAHDLPSRQRIRKPGRSRNLAPDGLGQNVARDVLAKTIWSEVAAATGLPDALPRWQIVRERR